MNRAAIIEEIIGDSPFLLGPQRNYPSRVLRLDYGRVQLRHRHKSDDKDWAVQTIDPQKCGQAEFEKFVNRISSLYLES